MTVAHTLPYKFWTRRPSARSAPVLTERSSRSLAALALSAQHFVSYSFFRRNHRRRVCGAYVHARDGDALRFNAAGANEQRTITKASLVITRPVTHHPPEAERPSRNS